MGRGATQSSAERHFVSEGSRARPRVSVLEPSCILAVCVRDAQALPQNLVISDDPRNAKIMIFTKIMKMTKFLWKFMNFVISMEIAKM